MLQHIDLLQRLMDSAHSEDQKDLCIVQGLSVKLLDETSAL